MDTKIIFSLIISSFILCFYFFLKKVSKTLNLPPGPPKLPLIGNIHQLAGELPHRAFRDLARKHGPIMHVQLGQISAIIISSPRLAKEVFKTQDIALANRPKSLGGDIVVYGSTDISLAPYGEYWRQMKKICSLELLSAKKVRSFDPIRKQEFNRFVELIRLSPGQPVNIHQTVTKMVNNVVCISSFGKNCRQQNQLIEFMEEMARVMSGLFVADLFPSLKFLPIVTGMKSKLMKLRKTLDEIFDGILEDHQGRRRDGEGGHEDLLEVLLRIKDGGSLEFPITIDNIKAIFVDIFSGGTDTSSTTIEWAMTEMIRNPSTMNKAQTEVREALKGKITIEEIDVQSLSYLQSIIKETLRLHPPIPLLLPRECREQCKIDGYDIPVKQKLIINSLACATDPEYWEDPENFKPERFDKKSIDFMGTNYEFVPFGAGRRMCPGITFGIKTIQFFLVAMLYHFDWKLPHGLNPVDIDMTEIDAMLAAKKVHLHMVPTFYSPSN